MLHVMTNLQSPPPPSWRTRLPKGWKSDGSQGELYLNWDAFHSTLAIMQSLGLSERPPPHWEGFPLLHTWSTGQGEEKVAMLQRQILASLLGGIY